MQRRSRSFFLGLFRVSHGQCAMSEGRRPARGARRESPSLGAGASTGGATDARRRSVEKHRRASADAAVRRMCGGEERGPRGAAGWLGGPEPRTGEGGEKARRTGGNGGKKHTPSTAASGAVGVHRENKGKRDESATRLGRGAGKGADARKGARGREERGGRTRSTVAGAPAKGAAPPRRARGSRRAAKAVVQEREREKEREGKETTRDGKGERKKKGRRDGHERDWKGRERWRTLPDAVVERGQDDRSAKLERAAR